MKAIKEHKSTILTLMIPALFIALIIFNAMSNGVMSY